MRHVPAPGRLHHYASDPFGHISRMLLHRPTYYSPTAGGNERGGGHTSPRIRQMPCCQVDHDSGIPSSPEPWIPANTLSAVTGRDVTRIPTASATALASAAANGITGVSPMLMLPYGPLP